jgi:hypothetical protein
MEMGGRLTAAAAAAKLAFGWIGAADESVRYQI